MNEKSSTKRNREIKVNRYERSEFGGSSVISKIAKPEQKYCVMCYVKRKNYEKRPHFENELYHTLGV
jgi:hypothetical protein